MSEEEYEPFPAKRPRLMNGETEEGTKCQGHLAERGEKSVSIIVTYEYFFLHFHIDHVDIQ